MEKGSASMNPRITNNKYCLESMTTICRADAPTTFRIPISFSLFSVVNVTIPNKPRQEMSMARPVAYCASVETLFSDAYCFC